jgi:hypothetical protein
MNNQTETLLLSVQVDIGATLKRLAELHQLLQQVVTSVVLLNKQFDKSKITLELYQAGQADLLRQTRQITQEQIVLTKAVVEQTKANKAARDVQQAAAGSIDELKSQLQAASKAYNALSKEERTNGEEGARLALQQQRLTALMAKATEERRAQAAADRQAAKDLAAFDKIQQSSVGSVEQLRAQLSQLKTAYSSLNEAERNSTEAGQNLQVQTKATNDQLLKADSVVNVFSRSIGNSTGAIEPLIAELVKLQEVQKRLPEGSKAYDDNIVKVRALQQAVNDAGIKMGLTYEQTQAKLHEVTEAVQPATAALVQLEEEQEKVEKGTEAYTQISFKIGQAQKAIEQTTGELKKAPPEIKKFSTGLKEAAANSDLLGGVTAKATEVQERFTQAQELAKLAVGGNVTALGALRLALIATGLGALLVVLGSLVTFLTKTAEGTRLVENVMAEVGAVVNVVIDRFGAFGKAVTQILRGDFSGAAATAKAAMSGLGDEIKREVKLSGDLSKARQQLDIDTNNNIATNKRLLNDVERLKNLRDNEFLGIKQRQAANEEAYKIELSREKILSDLARRKIEILQQEIDLRGGTTKASQEQVKELREAENELADIQEDAAGRQNEFITNRFTLAKEKIEQETKLREEAIKQRIANIQTELASVKEGSTRELELRENLLREEAALELVGAEKTAADKRLVLAKSLQDILKLDEEFEAKRQAIAKKFLEDGDNQRIAAFAADKKRKEDELKDNEDIYARNEAMLEHYLSRRQVDLEQDYADGKRSKKDYEGDLERLEDTGLAARYLLQKQFNKDTSKIEADQAKRQRTAAIKTRETEEQAYEERMDLARQFGSEIGTLFANTLTDTGKSLQDFAAGVFVIILDSLEKAALAAQAEAVIKNAPKGPIGFIESALEVAAITVAFEVAKAGISASVAKPFNTGGIVGGSLSPGSPNQDTELTYLTKGEVVMSRPAAQQFAPVLSYLNSLAGGANFTPGFSPLPTMQTDGGLMARTIGNSVPFDYDKFAAASAKHPIDVNYVAIDKKNAARKGVQKLTTLGGK